jgi:hypothetical protein
VVYQIGSNSCFRKDQPKGYRLVVSRCLLFVRVELVEVATLEALVLGA